MQGWSSEEIPDDEFNSYESITCAACGQLHFVNQATGRVVGEDRD